MINRNLFFVLLFLPQFLFAQKAVITEETKEFVTYPFSDPNPNPILMESKFKIYPYHSFDGYSQVSIKKKWKVVKLENDYIEVYILPEIGGKVWGAIEKSTGKEFIYSNDVVKFRNISLRGPWTSGGIEYNIGIIGHSPATATPVDYVTRENADGSVSCIVGNMDLPSRTQWRVEIRLSKDKAYFETIPLWYNPTNVAQSYYCYMTGAAAVSDDLEFFYPGNQSLEHEGNAHPWPVVETGHDLSKYKNDNYGSDKSNHVVGDYKGFMGGYFHNSEFGFGHWALYNDMPGKKLWLWSTARDGAIWTDLLTDKHGQYMEFQAGGTFNQYSQTPRRSTIKELAFNPGITDQWKEIWFPVKQIGGMQEVSPKGVLNVTHQNGNLFIGINSLAFVQAKLIVKSGDNIIYSEEKSFQPMDVYTKTIALADNEPYQISVEGMDLQNNSVNKSLIKRLFTNTIPADSSSASQWYMQANEYKENRNYKPAKACYLKCLQKDKLFVDASVALAELFYRSAQYDSALYYANQVLQLDTYNPSANYFAGITYLAQGDFINSLEALGWAARSLEFRTAAFALMASIELQLHDLPLAEHYANQALDFNNRNFNALKILSIIYRQQGNTEFADKTLATISSIDPLNHFADFERYLLHPTDENLTIFKSGIKNEFPYQTYLELAIEYANLNLNENALKVLDNAPEHALVSVWRAFLSKNIKFLDDAVKLSPSFVFPYRTETASALKWATANNTNWKFKYYLVLNYWAIDRVDEAKSLLQACNNEPDFATFYTSRAFLFKASDKKQAMADLQKAIQFDPTDWRNWSKLIEFYESIPDNKTALELSVEASKKFKGNFNLEIQCARVQLNNGQYVECLKTLGKTNVIPFEGSRQGKYMFEQAYIQLAIGLMDKKNYKGAMEKLELSKAWPENLGVGAPYGPDNRLQNYLEAICMDKLGKTKEAGVFRDSIVSYTETHYADFLPSFNNILSLWILQKEGKNDDANNLVNKIKEMETYNLPKHQWVVATFLKDEKIIQKLEKDLATNNYIKIIKKLRDL